MMFFDLVTAVDLLDELFDRRLSLCCRNVLFRDPPVCFFTVLEIVFLSACFGDFLLLTTSSSSGTLCLNSSFPIRLAVGRMNRLAKGRATRPMPAAKAPKPLPLYR